MLHKCNRSLSEAGRGEKAGSSSTLPGRLPSCFQQASRRKSKQFEQTGASSAQATQHSVRRALTHPHTLTATLHHPVLTHKLTEHMVLFWSLFRKNTQTVAQSIYQACKGTRDFQTIQIGNTLQTGTFYDNATNNLGRRTKHKLLKPVELLQTGPRGDYNATVTMTSQNRLQISH